MSAPLPWRRPAELLAAPTPAAWFEAAARDPGLLLLDHANCEKKAASTALALMFAYGDDLPLALQMSRLAREELRHYEQVMRVAAGLGHAPRRLAPGRYAARLREAVARREPARKLDLLVCGALIEARSCERFEGLAGRCAAPIDELYAGLAGAEARHFLVYLRHAAGVAAGQGLDLHARVATLAAFEAEAACAPDTELRFHSGPPAGTQAG